MEISKEILQDMADQLDFGLRCFFNINTDEVVAFPDDSQLQMESEIWETEKEKLYDDFDNFKEVKNISSSEGFELMAEFTNTINDNNLKRNLIQALEGHKPFVNFKHQIEQSDNYRKKWFAFKNDRLIESILRELDD